VCGGLPSTSTLPAETPKHGAIFAVLVVLAFIVVGGGVTLRCLTVRNR
jgi:hypothetical protein